MRPRVFLSYARTDVAIAKLLCENLAASDCAVWMDERELLAGDDFVQSLKEQLDRSDAIVFLLTHQSARSGWCLTELQRALAKGIVVIIVAAERDAVLPDALHRLLRDTHRVSWPESGPSLGQQIQRARRRRVRRLQARHRGGISVAGVDCSSVV